MTADLHHYITTEILPTVGDVETDALPIQDIESMIKWIRCNLRLELPDITPQSLSEYLLMDNETIIPKKRNLYLNTADFYDLELPIITPNMGNEHKEILSVLILPDAFCKSDEFYYCTCDEWMILTAQ